jgi:hypothetical protein
MKTLILLALAGWMTVGAQGAAADDAPYYRFWRGWRKPDLGVQEFNGDINRIFVPKTVKNGAGHGLMAYLPVLLPAQKPAGLPDEIALVTYKDLASYQQLGATPEGQAYTASHWNYFDHARSSSKVPEALASQAPAIDHAYDLKGGSVDWQQGDTFFSLYVRPAGFGDADYLAAVKRGLDRLSEAAPGVQGLLALVGDTYVIVYQNGKRTAPVLKLGELELFASYRLAKQAYGATKIEPGQGVSVTFDPGKAL